MPIDPRRLTSLAGSVKPPNKGGKRFGIEKKQAIPPKKTSDKAARFGRLAKQPPKPKDEEFEEEIPEEEAGFEEEVDENGEALPPSDDEMLENSDEPLAEEEEEPGMAIPDNPNPAAVIPILEMYMQEVEACCDEVDYDLLIDPEMPMEDDQAQIIQEGTGMLPPRLMHWIPNLAGITYDDAIVIASAMQDRGKTQDPDRLAGWLFRIGELLVGGAGGEEEGMEEDPDAEYEEGAEDEFAEEEPAEEEFA